MFSVTKVALGKVCREWSHQKANYGAFPSLGTALLHLQRASSRGFSETCNSHSSQGATKHQSSSEGSLSPSLPKAGKSWQVILLQCFPALKLVLVPDPALLQRVKL